MEESAGGRPTKYLPIYNKQAYELCLCGYLDEDLARFFDVHTDTINEWKKVYPQFKASIRKGKDPANALVAKSLFKNAVGFKTTEITFEKQDTKERLEATPDGEITGNPEYKKKVVIKEIAGDFRAQAFFLKNRVPDYWRDKQEIDHTSQGEKIGTVPPVIIQNPHEAKPSAV